MGTDSNWRFYLEFSGGFDVEVGTGIGRNLVESVLRFNECTDRVESKFCTDVRRFFLQDGEAVATVAEDIIHERGNLGWIHEVPEHLSCVLEFSEWTPIAAFVSFFVPRTPGSPVDRTLLDQWTCRFSVYESLPYEFLETHNRKSDKFSLPHRGKCPVKNLSPADFAGELEWRLYTDMMRFVPEQLSRRQPGYRRDRYWDFNLSAMCSAFASAVTRIPACRFKLSVPDTYEEWTWDSEGRLIEEYRDPDVYG